MQSDLPEPPSELIFGIDFGERYIGCAIGNTLSRSAQPLSSIVYQYPHYPLQELCTLIQTWQPQKLVIGEPFHMDGSRSQTADRCDIFIKALEKQCFLPIFRIDERLSTHAAKERIENLPRKKDRRDKRILNSVAAQIILETWLNH
jgi:putative holliday junction resolvase